MVKKEFSVKQISMGIWQTNLRNKLVLLFGSSDGIPHICMQTNIGSKLHKRFALFSNFTDDFVIILRVPGLVLA